jgi:hypothetical protein
MVRTALEREWQGDHNRAVNIDIRVPEVLAEKALKATHKMLSFFPFAIMWWQKRKKKKKKSH